MTKAEYEKALKKLMDKIIYCESNRQIYKRLTELCGIGKKYEDVAIKGDMFFSMIVHNLLNELLAELARLYDEGSFGLLKAINIVEQNQKLLSEYCDKEEIDQREIKQMITDAREKYNSVKDCRERLFEIRDKHLAHTDKKYVLNYGVLYDGFNWGYVEDLIMAAAEIINRITSLLRGAVTMYNWIGDDGVDVLIRAAHNGLNNKT